MFEGLGYSPEREYLHMEIDVPDGFDPGGSPAGIAIRPRIEADDPAIVAVMEEGFRQHWPYEDWVQEWLVSETYDPTLWLVALEGDEAVGAMQGHVTNGRGQISALAMRDAWRQRGIAEALLRAAFAMFRDRGIADVRLNVDRDNATGATRLYERAGMRLRRRWLMVAKTMTAARGRSY